MKKTSLKYLLFLFSVVFFSLNTFAQAPPDPGSDPLKSDTTKEITDLQTQATIPSTVHSDFLSDRKNSVDYSKRSDPLFLGKNEKENIRTSDK
jgi:hypothetical protein